MKCPTLKDLPSPPPGKTGWPWTEESRQLADHRPDGQPWPRISIITPSFNQGEFIEATIRSILLQGYPDLEYFILDGASKDDSVEIIRKYSTWLTFWVSQPDNGQSDAINRALKMASGSFTTWINSDDMLCKNALVDHASRAGFDANTVYVGICLYQDKDGNIISTHQGRVFSFEDLVCIRTVWRCKESRGHIDQPAVLFPRSLALSVGGINVNNYSTMDYELWGKFFLAGARFQYTDIPFGMFREHAGQKIKDVLRQTQSLLDTAAGLVNLADCFSDSKKKEILADLIAYKYEHQKNYWRGTGRLAKMGLPPWIVNPIRRLRTHLHKVPEQQPE